MQKRRAEHFKVAVATSGESGMVDVHFGHARSFFIYDVNDEKISFLEERKIDANYCGGPECDDPNSVFLKIVELLQDCRYLLCKRIGVTPARLLEKKGIRPVKYFGSIEDGIGKKLLLV